MQLKDFVVQLLHVEANPEFHPHRGSPTKDDLSVNFEMKQRKDGAQFRIDLDVRLNDSEARYKKCAYRIHIRIYGLFEFDRNTPKEDVDKLLGPNGLAMAYSVARGIVAEATGTSLHGKIMLPTVNFIELLKRKAESAKGKRAAGKSRARDHGSKKEQTT